METLTRGIIMKRVLVACEESQEVTKAFRKLGFEAWSCDLQKESGGHPEWHIRGDVREELKKEWDMIIAFPPCTDLCVSGAEHFETKKKDGRQRESIKFFRVFIDVACDRVAIENPIGIMSTRWRKPDQIIQPWEFGDTEKKSTCLWLKGLPLLVPTMVMSEQNETIHYMPPSKDRGVLRSKTFPGIAKAMADQWTVDWRQV